MQQLILKLTGKVKNYDWGGHEYIPKLLGVENKEHLPFAEYWLGAHQSAPSEILNGKQMHRLDAVIIKNPAQLIGEQIYKKFGGLPFLLKIMDVNAMLSIQVHPTKTGAEIGFDKEEAEKIPIDSPERNYKDRNHKPEMLIAISDFWLLHGFKEQELVLKILEVNSPFNFLISIFKKEGFKGLYTTIMEMSQSRVDEVLLPVIDSIWNLKEKYKPQQPAFWVKKLYHDKPSGNLDRGIFSIYLCNIVELHPSEGIFQGAGVPHAYLQGQGVELMANSDNVLRGGLTSKYIDVPELLKHTKFEATIPNILKGETRGGEEKFYDTPVEDFAISVLEIQSDCPYINISAFAEICIVTEGSVFIPEISLELKTGEAVYILPEASYSFIATEQAVLYKAFIPQR